MVEYWRRVHREAFTKTNSWFSLHRGKVFVTVLVGAGVIAFAIWKAQMDKAETMFWTFVIWIGAWLFVYLCHIITAPARFDAERGKVIADLEESLTKREAKKGAAKALMDLYGKALILGANPKNLNMAEWILRYDRWKDEVTKTLEPVSDEQTWMFKTLGDTNLVSMPESERDKFLVLFQEFKGKREKLRKIVARLLPKDDPKYEAMQGDEA